MPSVTISGNFRTFPRRLEAARKGLRDCLDRAMIDAIEVGVAFGKNAIETRGTGKTWQRPWHGRAGSYPGRVDTGEMLREFRGEVDIARTETTGKIGWTKEQLDYFIYQELGFQHLSGEEIEGMFALRDAANEAWEFLVAECSTCSSRFVRSI